MNSLIEFDDERRLRELNEQTLTLVKRLADKTFPYTGIGKSCSFPDFTCFLLQALGLAGLGLAIAERAGIFKGSTLPEFSTIELVAFMFITTSLLIYGLYMKLCKYNEDEKFSAEVLKAGVQIFDNTLQYESTTVSIRNTSPDKV
jgi:hypothetical protein